MGARPLGYLLTLCLPPGTTDTWLAAFAAGLAADQRGFGVKLWGGDTTRTDGPLTGSITIIGALPVGTAVRRGGARPGDAVYVTGTIGDGVLGLAAARGEIPDPDGYLAGRYNLPTPRNALAIGGQVHAAMDVSDGLIAEAWHIARASGVAITIEAPRVPLSQAARRYTDRLPDLLAGGDDFELLLTVAPEREASLCQRASQAGVALTRIGQCQAGSANVIITGADGRPLPIEKTGWSHFQ